MAFAFSAIGLPAKAKAMIEVLKRRKEIESYLTNLTISRSESATTTTNKEVVNNPERTVITINDTTTTTGTKSSTNVAEIKKDSAVVKAAPVTKLNNYSYSADSAQYVGVLLDKVDPVYQGEAKNAFNRFNKEKFYTQTIDISAVKIDDRFTLILEGPFANSAAAIEYLDRTKPAAGSRILPWLSGDKFSFIIISQSNLETLQASKNVDGYRQLLQAAVPGKF